MTPEFEKAAEIEANTPIGSGSTTLDWLMRVHPWLRELIDRLRAELKAWNHLGMSAEAADKAFREMESALAAARAREAELRKGLEPFARWAKHPTFVPWPDTMFLGTTFDEYGNEVVDSGTPTLGDLRRAAALLAASAPGVERLKKERDDDPLAGSGEVHLVSDDYLAGVDEMRRELAAAHAREAELRAGLRECRYMPSGFGCRACPEVRERLAALLAASASGGEGEK